MLNNRTVNSIFNSIAAVSNGIIPEYLVEGWLADYHYDFENTTKAVEKYLIHEIMYRFKTTDRVMMDIEPTIDNRIKFLINNKGIYKGNLGLTLKKINEVRQAEFNSFLVERMVNDINNIDVLLYMKSLLHDEKAIDKINPHQINSDTSVVKVLTVIESLKYLILNLSPKDERFVLIDESVKSLLQTFHNLDPNTTVILNYKVDVKINPYELDNISIGEIKQLFLELELLIENQCDPILDYMIEEFYCMSDRMNIIKKHYNSVTISATESLHIDEIKMSNLYDVALEKFDRMSYELFGEDSSDELDIDQLVEYYSLAKSIAGYEISLESSTKIISKGTEKVTRAIGDKSSRSRGMGDAKSKVDAVKRGARIVDDRASDAINKKLDQIMNIGRDASRERMITGKNTVKLGKAIKTAIGIMAGGKIAKMAYGPLVGTTISMITALGAYALSKRTDEREKKRILLELETELKITKEKIEDAKGDNNKKEKYRLMRIESTLEKEITRVKHGLRYY